MAKRVEAFEANDGSLHRDECSCAQHNVDLLIARCGVDMQPATAKALKDWLKSDADEIGRVISAFRRACPQTAIQRTDEASENGLKGPVAPAELDGDMS